MPNADFSVDPKVDRDLVYGSPTTPAHTARRSPSRLEEDYRNKFARQFRCEDGHEVRSLSEKDIDNWLYKRKIIHAYEPIVAIPEGLIPDFKVINSKGKDVYLEFWGMSDDLAYRERMFRKREIYSKYKLALVEIRPDDLKNLDFILSKKLIENGVVFIS